MSISLKRMLAEGFFYDVGTEKNEFESAVATATEGAKKKFEDSMKKKVIGQKVKVRASRGQPGQPEKDYVLEKVSAVSVDWYWKQYVVVFKDEKNKEFFLKPGFKVEVLTATQPGAAPTSQTPAEPPAPAQAKAPAPAQAPRGATVTAPLPAGQKNAIKPPVAEGGEEHEYKKEWAAQIVGEILFKFLSPQKQADPAVQNNPTRAVLPYIKSSKWVSSPGDGTSADHAEWVLEIPAEDMDPAVDVQEMKLEFNNELRGSSGAGGQYSRGGADIERVGRFYRFTIDYITGQDV